MTIKTDIIAEYTNDTGVTIDGVLLKDGNVDGADVSALATASHAAVTLGTDADVLLGLSTQQLTLDTQVANTVLAGPATGADADPTFRALVDADIPAGVMRDSEHALDAHTMTIDGVDVSAHAGGTATAQHSGGVGDHTHQSSGAAGGTLDHGLALTGLGDDDHSIYLLATGTRTGASSQAQTFTNGVILTSGNSYLGDTANASATQGLTLNQGAADDEILSLKSSDVAHGLTTVTETDTYGRLLKQSATLGGLRVAGISDGDGAGLELRGIIGASDPTDTTPAVILNAYKSNGTTGVAAVGNAETALQAQNNASALVTVLGSGNVGIGTTGPNEKLEVNGNIRTAIGSGGTLTLYDSDVNARNRLIAGADSSGAYIQSAYGSGVGDIRFIRASTEAMRIKNGNVGIGTTGPDRLLHAEASDAVTNAVTYGQRLSHITSGTAAAGFGVGQEYELEDAGGTNRIASYIETLWNDAAAATYKGDLILKVVDSAGTREGLRIRGSGTAATIGFLGAVPAAQIAHVADAVTAHAITDPGDSPADADALRDDLVTNVIPTIESALNALGTKINTLFTMAETFGFHAAA